MSFARNTIACLRDKKHGQVVVSWGVFRICCVCAFLGMEKHVPLCVQFLGTENNGALFVVCAFVFVRLVCMVVPSDCVVVVHRVYSIVGEGTLDG